MAKESGVPTYDHGSDIKPTPTWGHEGGSGKDDLGKNDMPKDKAPERD